jgi:hypothetical protein
MQLNRLFNSELVNLFRYRNRGHQGREIPDPRAALLESMAGYSARPAEAMSTPRQAGRGVAGRPALIHTPGGGYRRNGRRAMSDLSPLCAPMPTSNTGTAPP